MRLQIAPIVHVHNGLPHPDFPKTILQLFLLTEDQLDSLAHYYSQITPDAYTFMYPQTMSWDQEFLRRRGENERTGDEEFSLTDLDRLAIKRRKFAKFIGMRGAETPTWEVEFHLRAIGDRINRCLEEEEKLLSKKQY
jgi:hypothetical protein